MKTLLVGNPTAQSGKAAERMQRALQAMRDRGWTAELMETLPDGGTVPALAERLKEGAPDCVIYLGGDGTFAEVAKGIVTSGVMVPLGMLPSGTANDQGKSFGISSSPAALDENLDVISAQHRIQLDAGRIRRLREDGAEAESDLFFDSAGFGFQAQVLVQRNRDREAVEKVPVLRDVYRDQAVYAGAAVKSYLSSWVEPTKFDAKVLADGESHHYTGLTDLIVKATPIYGGEWVLERTSQPDDGLFELVPFASRREMLSKAVRDHKALPIWQEHLDELGITHSEGFSAKRFEIALSRRERESVHCQIDGEEWGAGERFEIEVLPGLLALVVREDWVAPWQLA